MPHLYIIGGPNGAGKTTAAMSLLSEYLDVYEFVNADEIAKGLNPLNPQSANFLAGRIMIERIQRLMKAKASFALETTCAGHHHIETIKQAKAAGYTTTLVFLWLLSADMAVQRVLSRVQQGGHNIPERTIRRRYIAGLKNLTGFFLPIVDKAVIYDNTQSYLQDSHKIAEKNENGLVIINSALWHKIVDC